MDGFQQSAVQAQSTAARSKLSTLQAKRTVWNRALKNFERSLDAITPAMNEHAEADDAMFAARHKLEALASPAALTVSINVEMYLNDGINPPILRRSRQTAELKDEADIQAFAKNDVAMKTKLLAVLHTYERKRAPLEASYEVAKALSEAKEAESSAVIDRSDHKQLLLFRTPAPGLKELALKIEMLHRADCSSHAEKQGWIYVLEELATFASNET